MKYFGVWNCTHFRAVFGQKKGDFEANVARGGGVAGCFWLDGGTSAHRHTRTAAWLHNGGRRTGKSAGAT